MVVQFADHESLALAFAELLRIGVPEQRISAHFEECPPGGLELSEHSWFLTQLHTWIQDSSDEHANRKSGTDRPTSQNFREHGGTLDIRCPQLDGKIMQTVLQHNGLLVA